MINASKNELFKALQESKQRYNQLTQQLRTLDMSQPMNRILVLELQPMIHLQRLKIESLKYYYNNFEKLHKFERQF